MLKRLRVSLFENVESQKILICFILIGSEKHSEYGSIRRDNESSKKPNRLLSVETLASILVGKYEWKSICSLSQEYSCTNSLSARAGVPLQIGK